jgi:hypothetical protein
LGVIQACAGPTPQHLKFCGPDLCEWYRGLYLGDARNRSHLSPSAQMVRPLVLLIVEPGMTQVSRAPLWQGRRPLGQTCLGSVLQGWRQLCYSSPIILQVRSLFIASLTGIGKLDR